MTDIFLKWAKFVTPQEGGIANDPNDAGGYTNKGLTFQSFLSVGKLINFPKPLNDQTFKNLTDNEVLLFKLWFWNNANLDNVKNPAVAMFLADINWAYLGAGKFAQQVLNNYFGYKLPLTNLLGSQTQKALNEVNQKDLYKAMVEQRKANLLAYIKAKPENKKFQKGWFKRLDDLYAISKEYLPVLGGTATIVFFCSLFI
jgi:type VI secretion system secreted protein VgrG